MFELLHALRLEFRRAREARDLNTPEQYASQLKRLQKQHRSHLFNNSCLLPLVRNIRVSDEDAVSYWRDHGPLTFDCCSLHRSLKQNLLKMQATWQDHQFASQNRSLEEYHQSTQEQIRAKLRQTEMQAIKANGERTRIFATGDAASLRFQLRLIDERLQRMLHRKRLTETCNQSTQDFVPPIDTGRATGREPVDIWYELAENVQTPPIMLRWLTEHRNPYISNRAYKTLGSDSKAA